MADLDSFAGLGIEPTAAQEEALTQQPFLPNEIVIQGQSIQPNWMLYDTVSVKRPWGTEEVEIYIPVLPVEFMSLGNIQGLRDYILYKTPDGYIEKLPEADLGKLDFNDVALRSGQMTFYSMMKQADMPDELISSPNIRDYLEAQVNRLFRGEPVNSSNIWQDLTKIQLDPAYADRLRMAGQMGGEIQTLKGFTPQDIATAQAMGGIFQPRPEDERPFYRTQSEKLEADQERLRARAEEAERRIQEGSLDPMNLFNATDQMLVAAREVYRGNERTLQEMRFRGRTEGIAGQVERGELELTPEVEAGIEQGRQLRGDRPREPSPSHEHPVQDILRKIRKQPRTAI
jgi:hypothetical protein